MTSFSAPTSWVTLPQTLAAGTTTVPSPVPTSAQNAAVIALRATLAAGNPLSGRQLETGVGLTPPRLVLAESSGHESRETEGSPSQD